MIPSHFAFQHVFSSPNLPSNFNCPRSRDLPLRSLALRLLDDILPYALMVSS